MKKSYVSIIVVVVIAGLGLTWYAVAHKTPKSTSGSMNMYSSSSNSSASASNQSSTQTTNSVAIQNFAFSPADITVKKGTTVTWTNKDTVAHTVTETDGKAGPHSGDVNPNATYTFTFTTPGTYHYHCAIHPDMVGTVTVTD